MHDATYLAITY